MNAWNDLMEYTDLTWARYGALQEAAAGTLKTMNGAMHQTMAELIGPDLQITEYGRQVLERAQAVLNGQKPAQASTNAWVFDKLNTSQAAYWMRKKGMGWIASVHIKLVRSLCTAPGQTYGHLVNTYGYRALQEALEHKLVQGELKMSHPFELGDEGQALVEYFVKMNLDANTILTGVGRGQDKN